MAAPAPQWWLSDNSAQVTATISATLNAGDTLAAVQYNLWNDKAGTLNATTLTNARLVAEAWDGANWVRDGLPIVDEGWVQASLTGKDSTGDASMATQTTGYIPLGGNRFILLSDIPKNCARYVSAKIVVPAGAENAGQEVRLVLIYAESSAPTGILTSLASGSGIIPDRLDASLRRLTTGGEITASGGETVTVAARGYAYDGTPYYRPPATITLNQTAADGALGVGQSYIAVLSQAAGTATPTTTKGNKAASPTAPATPAGEIYLGKVTVAYQAGGTSIINQGNVDTTGVVYGEFYLWAGSGLTLNIGAGRGISIADTEMFQTAHSTLSMTDNSANYVWVQPDGTFSKTTAAPPAAPVSGSVLLGVVSTSGGAITFVTPRSTVAKADRAVSVYVMRLEFLGPIITGTSLDWDILPFDAILESWRSVGATNPGPVNPANDTIFDVNAVQSSGTATIFTSQGTWDQRPRIVAGSFVNNVATSTGSSHEVRVFDAGTLFLLDIDQANPGGIDGALLLYFRMNK